MSAPSPATTSPWPDRIATAVTGLLALAFIAAGGAKLAQAQFELDAFVRFEIPVWLMIMAGAFEVIAAGLLIMRRSRTLGAIMGVGIMIVAIGAHLHAAEYPNAVVPTAFIGLFVWLGLRHRGDFARWIDPDR